MIKFSNTYQAKKKRIARLPALANDMVLGIIKRDCIEIIQEFKTGIKKNKLGLVSLSNITIKSKSKQGMTQPTTPLYGKGDERQKDSYINMLRLRKLKNGWKIYPSWGRHWKSKLKLRDLLTVHEYGTKITMPSGHIIQIPPRPAFLNAYKKFMAKKRKNKKEDAKEVKLAITEYINSADYGRARKFINQKKSDAEND